MRTATKIGLLSTLYFSQGLPFGFFTQALPVMLRERKLALETIGLASVLAAPWALKFLWAPLVDSSASRKAWILPLQGAAVILCALIAALDPAALSPLAAAVFLTNLIAATQDIATDGLAVDILSDKERGLGNGIQVAGYRVGMIVGGFLLLLAYAELGWTLTFLLMAALLLAASIPLLFFQEPKRVQNHPKALRIVAFVARPGMGIWLAFLCLYKFGDAFAGGMLRPFLVDQGLTLTDIGWVLGLGAFASGLTGALCGGVGVQRLGRRPALIGFGVLVTGVLAAFAVSAGLGVTGQPLKALCLVEHFVGGLATVTLFTTMMDRCDPHQGATDYTIQASVVVSATLGAAALSGFSASAMGYANHFLIAAILASVGVCAAAIVPIEVEPGLEVRLAGLPTEPVRSPNIPS